MKRITVDEVKRAARMNGLVLIQGSCGNGKKNACPLAALYLLDNDKTKGDFAEQVFNWAERRFGGLYIAGFVDAIDNGEHELNYGPEYNAGNEDGFECLQEFWPAPR